MDYTSETSFMFKFSPHQLLITVVMFGQRCTRTVMGPQIADINRMVVDMMREYRAADG